MSLPSSVIAGLTRCVRLAVIGVFVALMTAVLVTSPVGASSRTASGALDSAGLTSLTGTWDCCGQGGAGQQIFVIDGATGRGIEPSGNSFATITNSLVGDRATITTTYLDSTYVATFVGIVSGALITGTWTSNQNQSGTFTATLVSLSASPGSTATDVAPISSTISTPSQVFHSMRHNLINAAVTVVAIIFITFPANIFNRTFQANYDEIMSILAKWRRRVWRPWTWARESSKPAQVPRRDSTTPGRVNPLVFSLVLLAGSVMGALLNPRFGPNASSAEGLVATLIAFSVGAVLAWFVARLFRRYHGYATDTYLQALPLGLAIAALCVAVSRLSNFEPGYLYGVVVGVSFAGPLKERQGAHLTAISVGSTMVVAVLAWFLWLPVNALAHRHGTNVAVVVGDDVLGSIFVGGLVGSVISLIPIDFLPGKVIASWHRGVWAAIFFVATFLLIEVELRPSAGPTHPGHAPIETVIALFVLFGGATFWLRWYFERRSRPASGEDARPVQ